MIAVDIHLVSANGRHRDGELGTLLICNDEHTSSVNPNRGDYSCRMFRKGELRRHGGDHAKLWYGSAPSRTCKVLNHARLAEPVQNLVAKALAGMGYA